MPDSIEILELQRRIALYDDETAYRQLFYLFYKPLLHFTGSFVSNREVAEEIVSDVFIKIWQNRKHVDEIRNLKIYLYVSAKNNTLRYLHSQQKLTAIGLDELDVELQNNSQDPEELMITAEMMSKMERAIDTLPPRCKMVYKMVREDRLRYKEIAQILDISIKTIDNQLAIALRKIADAIQFDLRPVSSSLPPARES
ncbi:MAG: RNA polymerase sigma-70 factor [Chitinophagaceae bacterium]|nr:MAG: RNA polymerase sigma-70 factor [Chitinophagaceae bacterium]